MVKRSPLPSPTLTLTNQEARRFMLWHQYLWPPKKLKGKDGVMTLFERLGCIQFDTINVVGRNADLVLQSRISGYKAEILEELLYGDRELIDGWDKVASIYPVADWPYFERRRKIRREYLPSQSSEATDAAPRILEAIHEKGPLSSLDFKFEGKTDWFWAPTSVARAALETLYMTGEIGIHHRVNTRRVFDLLERLIPEKVFNQADPHETLEAHQDWHVKRRIGGMGLATPASGEHWLGILGGDKAVGRKEILSRLVEQGKVIPLAVERLDGQTLFARKEDLERWEAEKPARAPKAKMAFIAPLDNLIWNRKFIRDLFGFEYIWEVYKPKKVRQYGYYVLPVLYGDRFIARMDAKFDKKTKILNIINWWWEEDIEPNEAIRKAMDRSIREFGRYLGAEGIELGKALNKEPLFQEIEI